MAKVYVPTCEQFSEFSIVAYSGNQSRLYFSSFRMRLG